MMRGARLARGLGLVRSFSAAAEPAQAANAEEGVQAAILGLRQRLAAGEGQEHDQRRRTLRRLWWACGVCAGSWRAGAYLASRKP